MKVAFVLLLLSPIFSTNLRAQFAPSTPTCPPTAIYLALGTEVRGYPANANGKVAPCQRIAGSATNLQSANAIAISSNGSLHVNQFNNEGDLTIYRAGANGNVAPGRTVAFQNDLISNAIDSRQNDYVLFGFTSGLTVFIAPSGATQYTEQVSDFDLVYGGSIAIDKAGNLLMEGVDQNQNVTIDTYATSRTLKSPPRVRRLQGSLLGLSSAGQYSQFTNSLSIATDPQTGDLYVYSENTDGSNAKISVFAPEASGNVAPVRVISGVPTQLNANNVGFHTGSARIAVSAEGRLFVSEGQNTILVFAPGATGNVAPAQTIIDSTGIVVIDTLTFLGGIGVRSCVCHPAEGLRPF